MRVVSEPRFNHFLQALAQCELVVGVQFLLPFPSFDRQDDGPIFRRIHFFRFNNGLFELELLLEQNKKMILFEFSLCAIECAHVGELDALFVLRINNSSLAKEFTPCAVCCGEVFELFVVQVNGGRDVAFFDLPARMFIDRLFLRETNDEFAPVGSEYDVDRGSDVCEWICRMCCPSLCMRVHGTPP